MRDFFARQEAAKRTTLLLYCYFAAAMALFASVLTVAAYIFFYTSDLQRLYTNATPFNFSPSEWDPDVLLHIGVVISGLILSGSLYKYIRLRSGGGSLIAQMLGGRIIYPDSKDLLERRLLNIVEEMAIASGVTVPSIYLLEREWGINAFAAGFTEEDAVLGVTKGAIYYLNREELQGVIAHEFSHVLNGDMLVNIRLQGLLHGILVIGLLGEVLVKSFFEMESLPKDREQKGAGVVLLILGFLLLMIGYTGVFVGRVIKSAVSRQREFLADAAAVQFTRNPLGLANALKKIGGLDAGSKIHNPYASEISHMYFGNGLTPSWLNLMSTHPSLLARIKRLDPEFRGNFPKGIKPTKINPEEAMMYATGAAGHARDSAGEIVAIAAPQLKSHAFIHSLMAGMELLAAMRNDDLEFDRFTREVLNNFPVAVREATETFLGAQAVLYSLLLLKEDENESRCQSLAQLLPAEVCEEVQRLRPEMEQMLPECRLYLVDYALPTLKQLGQEHFYALTGTIRDLIRHDGEITIFEYTLFQIFNATTNHASPEKSSSDNSLDAVSHEISTILTFLARLNNRNENEARKRVMRASKEFGKEMTRFDFLANEAKSLKALDRSLHRLADCAMSLRRKAWEASLVCVADKEVIYINEAELLRGIAEKLSLPVPLWLKLPQNDDH